ncbi:MAG TPA: PilZ domain-containing protein [Planctomycetota bacterium]|nr:PilZ domain-containing protein [Planctomycetota bacterium]
MDLPQDPPPGVGERRASARAGPSLPLSITVENPTLSGRSDNLSQAGVFFFSSERLRVRVEYDEDGRRRSRSGWLVRVQRMSSETSGYAVEFDRGPG